MILIGALQRKNQNYVLNDFLFKRDIAAQKLWHIQKKRAMKEFIITKRYSYPLDQDNDAMDDSNELDRFYVKKIKSNSQDLTSQIDTNMEFEDDLDLIEYLSKVFKEDPDEIDIVEDENSLSFSGA